MTSGIRVKLDTFGNQLYGETPAPVRIEISDSKFNMVESRLIDSIDRPEFALEPGIYAVVAKTPSGNHVQQVVEVSENKMEECSLPLHRISRNETHEWAHLTQKIGQPGVEIIGMGKLNATWIRLWRRNGEAYEVEPFPLSKLEPVERRGDGVIYIANNLAPDVVCLQVGGKHVPWKCIAIPSSHVTKILVLPSASPGTHSLQVVVSSNNLALESLLALLQRGEVQEAAELDKKAALAERFLFSKTRDAAAAAVGGYYLLRTEDLERLHDWAEHLAEWFPRMSDGPIIRAWQIIAEYRNRKDAGSPEALEEARDRLLQAVQRGFPIYTEGLRLLRDGLLLFDRRSDGNDNGVQTALRRVGKYVASSDWTTTTTTFTGKTPDEPSPMLMSGIPETEFGLDYINPIITNHAKSLV